MTRISYSEDEERPGQFALWQANCRRSLQGKAGQTSLRELEHALLALPDKRLIKGVLQTEDGDVCAIGALAKYKGVAQTKADPDYEMEEVGVELGMPRLVAWKVVELNDIQIGGHFDYTKGPRGQWVPATPEERYKKVLAWVQKQLGHSNLHES